MIPIFVPGQYPAILTTWLLISIVVGIPTAFLSLLVFFMLEKIPSRWARLIPPAAGAAILLAVSLISFSGIPQSPEEYQRTWVPMMLLSFGLNAMVVLAPFPFIRPYLKKYSPYVVIPLTLFVTFFLLIAFGFIGGDAQIPPDTEYKMMIGKVYLVIAEFVIATLVYGGIALLERAMPGEMAKQEESKTQP